VDYFHGRTVERVEEGDGSNGAPVWTIFFEGGGEIRNYNPSLGMPSVEGFALTLTTLGVESGTTLSFGNEANPRSVVVYLDPTQYSMVDSTYTGGEEVYAQRSEANMPPSLPPHPDERAAEEPSEQWQREQAENLRDNDQATDDEDEA
jgi:hypothetical protein